MTAIRLHGRNPRLDDVARRIRNEFIDMPGIHLTFEQVRRLGDLSHEECERVLDRLVGEGFLTRDGQRRYRLREERSVLARRADPAPRHERSA